MKTFKLASGSLKSRPAEPGENIGKHIPWIEKAKANQSDLVCFPEMSVTGFCHNYHDFFRASEKIDGKSTQRMVQIATEYDITIGYGLAERNISDIVFNSYCFVSSKGFGEEK